MKNLYLLAFLAVLSLSALPAAAQSDAWQKALNSVLSSRNISSKNVPSSALSGDEISSGLKEALTIGAIKVVSQLGKMDGFNLDPKIHIPLPPTLQKIDNALTMMGIGRMTDDLELRINRAAEAATPKAKTLFVNSIKQMTIADAKSILSGPNDAATQYFKKTMSPDLAKEIYPLVQSAMAQTGVIKSYDQVMGQYSKVPFAADVKNNLNNYVVQKTMDGIFYYVAKEEASIRKDPAKRTTDLLKKVFASR